MTDGYLLVIKDDASKYLLLWETMTADAHSVVRTLLHWFSLFGVAYCWITDQGSHFKNTVIADLQHQLGAKHHFTTACYPWANGTVENAMKQVLRVFRVFR
jgi:transposase InsO family protein